MKSGGLVLGVLAVVGIGGLAFAASHKDDNSEAPVDLVTGPSGTTYQVQMVNSVQTSDGRNQLFFKVFDAAGLVLEYSQYQGDNSTRILVLTPEAPHQPGDPMWTQAVQDFDIFTSVPGLTASA